MTIELNEPKAPPRTCPHPHELRHTLFSARDYISGETFQIVACDGCGLVRTHPAPAPDRMSDYYPVSYYGLERRFVGPVDWMLDRVNSWKAKRLEAVAPRRPGSLLEVGCGHGLVLDQMRRRGWSVMGTEISEESSSYARNILGLDVRIGPLSDLRLPDSSCDLVVMWHVLEHVFDPARELAEVARILAPGGVLVVGVPNFGSLEARWGRDRWFHLDVPRHLTHFTKEALLRLLKDVGLEPVQVDFFSPEHDFVSFVQTCLNKLGIPFNTLYRLLRRQGAKIETGTNRRDATSVMLTLALTPPLGVLSLLWVPVTALLRQGSAMVARAAKPSGSRSELG